MRLYLPFVFILFLNLSIAGATEELKYDVEVQVVDLQVSVSDQNGNFVTDLKPDDFLVWEDKVPQEVLDLDTTREPFSIGIVLDTSSSMQRAWRTTARFTEEFVSAMHPEDEFFELRSVHFAAQNVGGLEEKRFELGKGDFFASQD